MTEVIPGAYYIVISETFKNLLIQVMKIDDSKLVVIPGGLLIKQILGSSDALWKLIEERDILKKFPILITPANILERKNIEYAIEVVFSLKSKFPDIIYLISGKTSVHRNTNKYREELGIKIKELGLEQNVIFAGEEIGPLSYEDVCCLYRLADAVFYFSKSENFGIPILESAINKTPIFTSNLAVLNELGGDHVEYVDYKETAPEKASEIISNYLENDNLTKLRRRVRSKYYLKNILKEKLIPLLA
jgi:glycosyltransferase involved in cell wall biosynthesis